MPRRARQLIPAGLPYSREAVAACAVLVLLAHLLLAQLTFALAVAFVVTGRLSRWRRWWLLVPAAAGLVLTLAAGPARAAASFAAGPAHVLGYLGHGQLAARLARPLAAFAGAGSWLPGQLPIALMAGAAEAAALGWLAWLRTDEWAVVPPRPGVIAALRGALAARLIAAGGVVTRTGCALGVVTATGAIAELRWSQVAGGALVVGASAQEATITSLQVVHAALRRRKPLVIIDAGPDDASVARAVLAACRATGTPLRAAGTDPGLVIGERAAVLVAARSPDRAVQACRDLMALAADLHRIGVDGDGLVWVPRGERLPARTLAALIRAGGPAGLAVLVTTASPAAAAELAGVAGALLVHRIADPALAASLAGRTGTRLRPAVAGTAVPPGSPSGPGPGWSTPATGVLDGPATEAPTAPAEATATAGLVPYPVVQPRTLLSLERGQFVLAVGESGRRRAEVGRLVSARLPRGDVTPDGARRGGEEPDAAERGASAQRGRHW